jgi:hypothetical protein
VPRIFAEKEVKERPHVMHRELERAMTAIDEALEDAKRDLKNHADDPPEIRKFLAGVVDGLKKAKWAVHNL